MKILLAIAMGLFVSTSFATTENYDEFSGANEELTLDSAADYGKTLDAILDLLTGLFGGGGDSQLCKDAYKKYGKTKDDASPHLIDLVANACATDASGPQCKAQMSFADAVKSCYK